MTTDDEQRRRIASVLACVEWMWQVCHPRPTCPWCREPQLDGHTEDCWLDSGLRWLKESADEWEPLVGAEAAKLALAAALARAEKAAVADDLNTPEIPESSRSDEECD